MRIGKKDIEHIAKENCFNEIDFDKWIAFEHRQMLYTKNEIFHQGIVICLEHLKKCYEKGTKEELNLRVELKDCIQVAHFQAIDLYQKSEGNQTYFEEAMLAYDIFYLLRDTEYYLQNQLSWKVMNKWYD